MNFFRGNGACKFTNNKDKSLLTNREKRTLAPFPGHFPGPAMAAQPLAQVASDAVQRIKDAAIAKKSRELYERGIASLLKYLLASSPDMLSPAFLAKARADPAPEITQRWVHSEILTSPINAANFPLCDTFCGDVFEKYLASLRTKKGASPAPTTLASHRSSLTHLLTSFNKPLSIEQQDSLKTFMRGTKRLAARHKAETGEGKMTEGKEPLQFSQYCILARALLHGDADFNWGHTFLVISWNLMCRACNTETIHYSHMAWQGDALGIYFAHMKNDQEGSRPKDPRHIYANPKLPEICPLLSLGIYFLSFDFDDGGKLFSGDSQKTRFSKLLPRVLASEELAAVLASAGKVKADFGTHSIRKGGATYCTSGSTQCPSATSVYLRAGWTIEGVQSRYLRYESAGDQFVGRTICGLPIDDADFALLPPLFPPGDVDVVDALKKCFPHMPPQLAGVLEFALASVVYHVDYLRAHLPKTHRIWSSPLFQQADILPPLRSKVRLRRFFDEERRLPATGAH